MLMTFSCDYYRYPFCVCLSSPHCRVSPWPTYEHVEGPFLSEYYWVIPGIRCIHSCPLFEIRSTYNSGYIIVA